MADLSNLTDAPAVAEQFAGPLGTVLNLVWTGIVATLMTDVWQLLLRAVAGVPAANWALVGRWVAWIPRGVFVHRPITATAAVRGELAIGWAFHYAVGIAYAAAYLAIMELGFGTAPSLATAVAFSIVLLVAPWFVMQPALGLGMMARRAPNAGVLRVINLSTHAAFGVGLYLGAFIWKGIA